MEIVCNDLSIGYTNKAIHTNINLTIPGGSYTCIIGENGIGKSTLIKTLLGLIPPISGSILIGEGNKKFPIGYLPQQTQVQRNFPASVFEVTISGCLKKTGLRPFYNKEERSLARENLVRLGIFELAKKSYSELSGGQQQRVLLARALCATKEILLLDEPTAGLDTASQSEFYRIVKELNKDGVTIIMITHNLPEVIEDTDYIVKIHQDKVECLTKEDYEKGEMI